MATRLYDLSRITAGNIRVTAGTALLGLLLSGGVEVGAQERVAWRASAQPIFSIGGAMATDTVAQFVRPDAAVRLSDGRVVVLESDQTRWFDATGKYLSTSTRRGRGPGETQYATSMIRLAGDTVVTEQRRPLKRIFIAPSGKVAREETPDDARYRSLGRWAECLDRMLPDLGRLGCLRVDSAPPRADPGPGLLRQYTRFVHVPRDLSAVHALGRDMGLEQFGVTVGDRTRYLMHPFHTRSFAAAGGTPMRIAIATNPEYEVELWTPEGRLERTLKRENARRAPTARESEAAAAVLATSRMLGPQRDDPAEKARILGAVEVPRLLAAVADLAIASTGHVLVGREGHLPTQAATIIDVFDPAGRYLGILRLPQRFRMLDVGADYILGMRFDENDVVSIEAYKLAKTP